MIKNLPIPYFHFTNRKILILRQNPLYMGVKKMKLFLDIIPFSFIYFDLFYFLLAIYELDLVFI